MQDLHVVVASERNATLDAGLLAKHGTVRVLPVTIVGLDSAWHHADAGSGARLSSVDDSRKEPQSQLASERRQSIYAGIVGHEQAVRGAAVGQYVRMAQSALAQTQSEKGVDSDARFAADRSFVRRDLLGAMLLYMTGGLGAGPPGTTIRERI
jgi:hypothetical protein